VGSPSELKSRITEKGHTVVDLDLIDPPADAWERLKAIPGVIGASQSENRVKVISSVEDSYQDIVMSSARMGFRLRNAAVDRPSLEDVFLHFTGRAMVDEVKEKVPNGHGGHGPFRALRPRGR
jgi:hypothetical protein